MANWVAQYSPFSKCYFVADLPPEYKLNPYERQFDLSPNEARSILDKYPSEGNGVVLGGERYLIHSVPADAPELIAHQAPYEAVKT